MEKFKSGKETFANLLKSLRLDYSNPPVETTIDVDTQKFISQQNIKSVNCFILYLIKRALTCCSNKPSGF